MAAARRPAARVGPAPQVNYCDFATLLAALSATVASALSSAVADKAQKIEITHFSCDCEDANPLGKIIQAQNGDLPC